MSQRETPHLLSPYCRRAQRHRTPGSQGWVSWFQPWPHRMLRRPHGWRRPTRGSGGCDLWPHQLQLRLPSLLPSWQWPLLRRSWTSTEGIHREGTFSFSASIWSWVESPDVWSFVCRNHHKEFLHSVTCNLYIHYHTHPVQKDWKNNRAIARPIERLFQTSKAMTRPMCVSRVAAAPQVGSFTRPFRAIHSSGVNMAPQLRSLTLF